MLILCALTAVVRERGREKVEKRIQKRMRCLDAFGATGITGLQWQLHHHHDDVEVTVSDINPESVRNMRRNCILNNLLAEDNLSDGKRLEQSNEMMKEEREDVDRLHRGGTGVVVIRINESMNKEVAETHCEKVKDQSDDGKNEKISNVATSSETPFSDNDSSRNDGTVTLVCCDANLLMRQRFFDFIFLDPYGCATPFMDSAFSNISNNGILAITSTDTASLYGKCPQVTLRNYGGQVAKCEYLKELAGRLVVAAAVRAAARCNKGLEVLLCVALEHFVLVILRVRRGSGQADRSVQEVQHVLHCRVCGQRKFVPSTLTVPNSMYDHLSCTCHKSAPCTAMLLGPVWSGSIFDAGFIDRMAHAGVELRLSKKDLQLLHTLLEEATCSGPKSLQMNASLPETKAHQTTMEAGQKRGRLVDANDLSNTHDKRRRCDENQGQPAFYFSLPQHSIKNMDKPRIKTFIECLRMAGHRASRTHFDPEGVRTNAALANFKAVLQDASTPTMK
eukprot:XP_011667659.1 PREDICTED: TRMT1-like protein [Strongylocentrotus purpuratus]